MEKAAREAPSESLSSEFSLQTEAFGVWGQESGTLFSGGDSHGRLPRKPTQQHHFLVLLPLTQLKTPATESRDWRVKKCFMERSLS